MTVLPSLVDAAAVALVGAFVWYITRGHSNQLKELLQLQAGRIDRLEDRMDAGFARVDARFERVEGEIAAVRSDLTQIALAVGARARPQTR